MNFEAMRILAESDIPTFQRVLSKYGLIVAGNNRHSNLNPCVQSEQIAALNSMIAEDVNEHVELTTEQTMLRSLAESKGLVVVVQN